MPVNLSVVIPCYNEEGNVKPLYDRLTEVLKNLNTSYEILFVDDGSTDRTQATLERILKGDSHVRIIRMRRNFGQTAAFDAGFKNARGGTIVTLDADLQNDPVDIPRLLEKMKEGYDVVSGWRARRRDPALKKIASLFANILRRMLTKDVIHDSGCSLKAYKRECFVHLDLYGEMHRFIPSLLAWKGFTIGEIKVKHHPRRRGKTKYGAARLMKGFLDLLVVKFWMQYSMRPIHLFGGVGILSFVIGFIIGLYLVAMKILYGVALSNRPLLLLSILLVILGVQLLAFGILGDIMVKTYYKGSIKNYEIERISGK